MRCLIALETSGRAGGVAVTDTEGICLAEDVLDEASRHGRGLMPSIETCLATAGLATADIAGVAVDAGPGSYTGLRVGVMSAKALAFALRVPVIGVASLDAIAWHERLRAPVLAVCTDARRDEVYFAVYDCTPACATRRGVIRAISPDEALAELVTLPAGTPCVGSGRTRIGPERFAESVPQIACEAEPVEPRPSAVGLLGARRLAACPEGEPLHAFQPCYPRRDGVEMQLLGEGYHAPA